MIVPGYKNGFARSECESAYPGLWKGLRAAWMPSFGHVGRTLRDIVTSSTMTMHAALATTGAWNVGQYGWHLTSAGTNNNKLVGDDATFLQDDFAQFTIACRFRGANSTRKGLFGRCAADEDGTFYLGCGNTGDEIRFVTNGVTASATCDLLDAAIWSTTVWHTAIGIRFSATDHRLYLDGAEIVAVGTDTGSIAASGNAWQILSFGSLEYPGDVGDCLFYDRALGESEVRRLGVDLVAPFRLRQRVYKAPAAPGGLSIPIAMHHYKQLQGAC